MLYNYEKGYVHIHTEKTIKAINGKKQGRPKIRYNICLRDGKLTPIHENITIKELKEIEAEITKQGNKLY